MLLNHVPAEKLEVRNGGGLPVPSSAIQGPKSMGEFSAYNAVPGQTDSRPFEMASGKRVYEGALATADDSIPFGTKVHVPQLGKTFTVEDRLGPRIRQQFKQDGQHRFDIYTKTHADAIKFGRQKLDYIILK